MSSLKIKSKEGKKKSSPLALSTRKKPKIGFENSISVLKVEKARKN